MASIHRIARSPYYHCAFTDADGTRVFRSTKQTKASEAWRVAHALEDAARDARCGLVTAAHMSKVITSTVKKVHPEGASVLTTREWFESWVQNKSASRAEKTGERYGGIAKDFLHSLGKKADQPLFALNHFEIQKYRDAKVKAGLSNSSVDVILKAIRSCLELAVRQQQLSNNPANAVDLLGRDKSSVKRAFTKEEVGKLIDAAPSDEWKGITLVGYYVGGRLRNCARIKWTQIDLDLGLITYEPVKQKHGGTSQTLTVPIHPDLRAFLESRDKNSEFVFPTLALMPVEGKVGLSLRFRAIIDASGISYAVKKARGKAGRQSFALGFHALRRSFNSDLANAGVSQEMRKRLVGHLDSFRLVPASFRGSTFAWNSVPQA